MTENPSPINNLNDLRDFVYETLCSQNELEAGAFGMSERILVRRGKPCGLYFCVHGPRSVKLTAIWETEGNSVLFYGSSGQRRGKAQLLSTGALAAGLT